MTFNIMLKWKIITMLDTNFVYIYIYTISEQVSSIHFTRTKHPSIGIYGINYRKVNYRRSKFIINFPKKAFELLDMKKISE